MTAEKTSGQSVPKAPKLSEGLFLMDSIEGLRFPGNILSFSSVQRTVHPTQKPVELCEYLIKVHPAGKREGKIQYLFVELYVILGVGGDEYG